MMIKAIQVIKEAEDDLETGKAFYDEIEPGIGNYFWDSLLADLESLLIFAGIHKKQFGFYCMYAKRFPYAIYYSVQGEIATVSAILPVKRNPKWLLKQLDSR